MFTKIKKAFYFPIAYYFRFFAKIQLALWKPKIVVITGSNAKTTLLNLIESQIGNRAKYSHQANSSFGIPFDILGLQRKKLTLDEWPALFLLAPFKAFKKPFSQNLYIVEADCDRPYEGKFLSTLLKPEITIWINVGKSHSMNFPEPVEANIAYEFGYFLEYTKNLAIINGNSGLIKKQINRTKAKILEVTKKDLEKYKINKKSSKFLINGENYKFNYLLPEESFYQIQATLKILQHLNLEANTSFSKFVMPPGRSSLFKGIKNTTIIDSSYNATPSSVKVMLNLFKKYPAKNKWLVLGDMIELGTGEEKEHQNLAKQIDEVGAKQVILVGPRLSKYTNPKSKTLKLNGPKEVLDYLGKNIKGGEVILFKGARFLEGVIEHLLKNKDDVKKLCRREEIWQIRRAGWGL